MSILHFQSTTGLGTSLSALLTAGNTNGTSGAGYQRGVGGTLTPNTIQGQNIEDLRYLINAFTDPEFEFNVTIGLDPGQSWFTSLLVEPLILELPYTLLSADAAYIYTSGEARWTWSAGFDAMLNGRQYNIKIN